ncbi:hypothetical protein NC652_009963 [Populus alba x Populus x berolinensis]|nr:hypothetical protein NC652_009963 [Populus alba x Populus x berolinensis]
MAYSWPRYEQIQRGLVAEKVKKRKTKQNKTKQKGDGRETHRLCSMKCWSSPSCKDCAISSFRNLIPRPRFSSAANGLPLQLPSSLLLPDD